MPQFRFEAVDGSGRKLRGVTAGAGTAAVEADLEGRGLLPLKVREVEQRGQGGFGFGRRRDVLEVSRAVSGLLDAGLPLSRGLALAEDHVSEGIRGVLGEVRAAVEQGDSLAAALERHPRLFSALYRGLVRAGEGSGELAGAFARLVEHLEREDETRGRILSASIYPLVLVTFGGLSLLAILLWVVPRFAELITDAGAELPATAAVLLTVSESLRAYGTAALGVVVVAVLAFVWASVTDDGRRRLGHLVLALPLVGGLRREVLAGRFARLLGTLLHGGAPVLSALEATEASVADPLLAAAARTVHAQVRHGERLARAMADTGFFPRIVTRLVGVGEDSGRLPDFTLKAADIMERRTDQQVRRLVSLIEPTVIVVFGGLIALVAISLLQAVYGVNAGTFG